MIFRTLSSPAAALSRAAGRRSAAAVSRRAESDKPTALDFEAAPVSTSRLADKEEGGHERVVSESFFDSRTGESTHIVVMIARAVTALNIRSST